jgi:cold shock CspA family protein
MNGTIVLVSKRGFFFVSDDETGKQYFLHIKNVADRVLLKEGDRMRFDVDPHPQGRNQAQAVSAVKLAAADIEKDSHNEISIQAKR